MGDNVFKARGSLKSEKPDAGGAVVKTVPMLGIVKDNIDPTRSGRIRVFISQLGGLDPEDEKSWTPLLYMSSFFGATTGTSGKNDYGSFKTNPTSYGMWSSPPDIGTVVVCLFINGDPNFGFYIGSIPDAEKLRMVPAIGSNFIDQQEKIIFNDSEASSYGGATRLPVTNMNVENENEANSNEFIKTPKPVHSYQAWIMAQQGILRDPIRGPISSSAQRESPSRVGWGVSTPGRPIYNGGFTDETIAQNVAAGHSAPNQLNVVGRRGGHTFVMDDGDLIGQDNLVRIRTSLGHQIMMNDSGQTLMILHSNGQSYIELGKEGTIDLYSTNSVNIRTQGDLNLHADRNININAGGKLNLQGDSIQVNSEKSISQKAGADYKVSTQGMYTHKVGGAMSMQSSGDASYASSSVMFVNGSKINLNTGSTSTVPEDVPAIPVNAHTDTLYDSEKGFAAAPGKLLSITSRAPAHAPWANAGQGVDVKVDLGSTSQLPPAPSSAVATTNNAAASQATAPSVTAPVAATAPNVGAVSASIDKNTTAAMIGAAATSAATAAAEGTQAATAIGQLALTPQQIENAGVLKPGSSERAASLLAAGVPPAEVLTPQLFTGQMGVPDLGSLVVNVNAQANVMVTNLQQAQTALTQAGAITGQEAPSAIAGTVMSAATVGLNPTLNTIKTIGSTAVGAVTGLVSSTVASVTGAASAVTKAIAGGNFAANLAQNLTSGLGGLSTALNLKGKAEGLSGAVDSAKGLAAGAFASVTSSFKAFKANVPVDPAKVVAENKALSAAQDAATDIAGKGLNVSGLADKLTSGLGTTVNAASSALGSLSNGLNLPSVKDVVASNLPKLGGVDVASAASTLASGVDSLPGGASAISAIAGTTIPGIETAKSLINNSVTAVTNGISLDKSISGLADVAGQGLNLAGLSNPLAGDIGKLTSTATGALDKLKSGQSTLVGLASSGLGASAATKLGSALSALGSGGAFEIKLPTVAADTNNRADLDGKAAAVLGSGIPAPNFGGKISEAATAGLTKLAESRQAKEDKLAELNAKFKDLQTELNANIKEYNEAKNTLPAGDPKLEQIKTAGIAILEKQMNLHAEMKKIEQA